MRSLFASALFVSALGAVALPGPAEAAEATKDCTTIKDDPLRLLCFDQAAKAKPAVPQSDPGEGAPTDGAAATTKEIVAPIAPSDYRLADPADLRVAPRKFLGKPIEIRGVHCYYADVGDYRCLTPGLSVVAVFSSSVEPPQEKTRLEDDCGAMKAATTPLCARTLHLVLDDFAEDQPNALVNRVVLRPKTIIIVPATAARKRR